MNSRLQWFVFVGILALYLGFGLGFFLASRNACQPPEKRPPIVRLKDVGGLLLSLPIATVHVTLTHFSSTRDQTDSTPFITASGTRVSRRTLALSPDLLKKFPFGARMRIEGQEYIVEDRMSGKWENRADRWVETKEKALALGKKAVLMEVLDLP